MKISGFFICLGVVLNIAVYSASANIAPSPSIFAARNEIIDFRFSVGQKILRKELHSPASSLLAEYYLHYIDFLKLFATQNPTEYNAFIENTKPLIEKCEQLPDGEPYRNFLLGEIYFQQATLRFRFGKYLFAGTDYKKCYSLLVENKRRFPSFYESYKTLGLIHSLIGTVPEKYQWLLNLSGMEGTLAQGKEELQQAMANAALVKPEARILLAYLYFHIYDDKATGYRMIGEMYGEDPRSMLLTFVFTSFSLGLHKNEEAITFMDTADRLRTDTSCYYIPHMDYYRGEIFMRKNMYMKAAYYFKLYALTYPGMNYRKDAWFKAGLACELSGNTDRALEFYRRAADMENTDVEEDKYAGKLAPYYLTHRLTAFGKNIWQARHYFDGGYYDSCRQILDQLELQESSLSPDEQIELYYRSGRLYDELNEHSRALACYTRCFTNVPFDSDREVEWMAAYADYYAGLIAEENKDIPGAIRYMKNALAYKDYAYESGLEFRAKAALQRLVK